MSLLRDLRAPKVTNADESLYSFVRRRFGSEIAEYVIDPLARGVFAGNARELSVRSLAAPLHDWEQQHGGVIKGALRGAIGGIFSARNKDENERNPLVMKARKEKWAVWSLEGGMERLIDALRRDVESRGVTIETNSPVDELSLNSSGRLSVRCGKKVHSPDQVISCLPSTQLATLTQGIHPEVSSLLSSIPYTTVAVVNLEYEGDGIVSQPAFGYLVPSSEPSKVLGVIFDTCTFPQGNRTILTIMMGGYWFKSAFGGESPSKELLLQTAVEEVRASLGVVVAPKEHCVSVLRDCIPQYVVGHAATVKCLRRLLRGEQGGRRGVALALAGNAYDGVGVNDAILSARSAVRETINNL